MTGLDVRRPGGARLSKRKCARGLALALPALAAIVLSVPAISQPSRPRAPQGLAVNPDSALTATLARMQGQRLRLDEAIRLARTHATAVKEAQAGLRAAAGALLQEKGAFDPELFADLSLAQSETPSASPFSRPDVVKDETTSTTAGARLLLPFGTEIEASVGARRLDTNSEFAAIDPSYTADSRLSLRHPLLRGFGPGTSSGKTAAARSVDAARALVRDAQLSTRSQVEATYWELFAGERDVAVQQLIAESAEALLEQARLRASAGLVGPNAVATARVFLAEQRLEVLDQQESLEEISDRLASLMGTRPRGAARFRPADEPPADFPVEALEDALARAFDNNQSLSAARRSVEALEAQVDGARWNRLPALDVVGSLGGNGLSGSSRPVVFGGDTLLVRVDGGYGDAIGQAVGRDFPNWSVGVEFSLPLPLREGRGERDRLRAEAERARAQMESVRRALDERVRAAHRELVNSRRRLDVAQEGVSASFEQVRIGLIEYDNGRTTAFELVRLGSDLADAQRRLSDALVRAATASADLRYLTAQADDPMNEEASP